MDLNPGMNSIYTIGHSIHKIEKFLDLLRQHQITAIGDVRSCPYSRFASQYSREAIRTTLKSVKISYVFLGDELGARSRNPLCYENGRVQFLRLAQEPEFLKGIDRLVQGASHHRIALMCAEKDPLECHRALLIGRSLSDVNVAVDHIYADGRVETHGDMETRLLAIHRLPEGDMFRSKKDFIVDAYRLQGEHIAYRDESMTEKA